MAIKDVTESTFADEVLMAPGLVIVDYWADWCAPCKKIAPVLEELDGEYDDVKIVKVDTNDQPGLAAQQGVLSLPTLQFFRDGRVQHSVTGARTKNFLKKAIDEHR